jgi:hypothetical protein
MTTTSSGSPIGRIYGAAVNNSLLDPLQGFDADVWVTDQATGQYRLIGRFTSIQLTIRNATEPYLEFNQRMPRYLDGEIQIGWVLERGQLDSRILQHTFGFSAMTREMRIGRSPRFQIAFEMEARELDLDRTADSAQGAQTYDPNQGTIGNGELNVEGLSSNPDQGVLRRRAKGKYLLTYCKVDSLTIGATAGRSVIANRWEGLSEGIEFIEATSVWSGTTLPIAQPAEQALRSLQNIQQERQYGLPRTLVGLGSLGTSGNSTGGVPTGVTF